MDQTLLDEMCNSLLFKHKDMYFKKKACTPEVVDSIEHMEIRDSDVFLVAYPKSGTVWIQNILCLIVKENQGIVAEAADNMAKAPWIEYNIYNIDFDSRPSPRLFTSHLPYYLMPKDLSRRGKVIYVYRNPKDNVVSFYHFYKLFVKFKHITITWEAFFDLYMSGKVFGGLWFDHVRGWYSHKEEFNCLFLSYEEMIKTMACLDGTSGDITGYMPNGIFIHFTSILKDLRSAVLKICQFVDMKLDDQAVNRIVEKATFKNMKQDPLANYTFISKELLDQSKGDFLRKGIIGDWKNLMNLAQSEKMDEVLKEKLGDLSITFIWDSNEETKS